MGSTEDVGLDSKLPQENETVEYSITLNRVYIIGESVISLETSYQNQFILLEWR